MDRLDSGSERDASIVARRELYQRQINLASQVERVFTEKDMPEVNIKKRSLGDFNPKMEINLDEEITVKPIKYDNEDDWWNVIAWTVKKGSSDSVAESFPGLGSEEVGKTGIESLKDVLPRTYLPVRETTKCYLYKNESGEVVGWLAFDEYSKREGHLSFVGVRPGYEGKRYGEAMLAHLQNKYDAISLIPLPYDLGQRKGVDLTKRLFSFYAKSGFVYDGSGFYWGREIPNLETLKPGEEIRIFDRAIASGINISNDNLRVAYLNELIEQGIIDKVLSKDEAELARNYLEVRKQYKELAKR